MRGAKVIGNSMARLNRSRTQAARKSQNGNILAARKKAPPHHTRGERHLRRIEGAKAHLHTVTKSEPPGLRELSPPAGPPAPPSTYPNLEHSYRPKAPVGSAAATARGLRNSNMKFRISGALVKRRHSWRRGMFLHALCLG